MSQYRRFSRWNEYTRKHDPWKEEVKKWKAVNKQWLQEDTKAKAQLAG
jgi:hypothetical protein